MTHSPAPAGATRPSRAVAALGLTLALAAVGLAQPPAKNGEPDVPLPPPAAAPTGPTLSLGECIGIGLERNPTVKAAVHSLNAARAGQHALGNLPRYASFLKKDIPVRQQQSAHGVTIAEAEVKKARGDVTYDVTRLYYTYVYATQQEKTANDVIEQMEVFYKVAEEIWKTGIQDAKIRVNQFTLYNLRNRITDVKLLQIRAEVGRKQALDALKEAMGVEESFTFVPRDTELPLMGGSVSKEQVIQLAMSNRPEIVQATAGMDAFRLEVCAQSKAARASGADARGRQRPALPSGAAGRADRRRVSTRRHHAGDAARNGWPNRGPRGPGLGTQPPTRRGHGESNQPDPAGGGQRLLDLGRGDPATRRGQEAV